MKVGSGGGKRSESDKEKTKMRERQRRAITTNIFHGLRKHGGYRLSPRADINEVLRELAKEAGWVIEPDGTTYRSKFWDSKVSNSCPQCGALQTTTNLTPTSGAVIGGGGGGECSTTALGDPLSSIDVMSGSLVCFPESFNGRCRQPFPVPVYTYQELTGEAQSGDGEDGRNSSDVSFVECSAIAMMTCQQQGEVLRFEAVSRSNQRTMEGSSLHHS